MTPAGNTVGALGGASSLRLTTSPGCAWTATATGTGWFHLTSAASGSGMATLGYTVDANGGTQQRTAAVTVAGLTFTLTQQSGAPPNTPVIAENGIVNAASNRSGSIARGSVLHHLWCEPGSVALPASSGLSYSGHHGRRCRDRVARFLQ